MNNLFKNMVVLHLVMLVLSSCNPKPQDSKKASFAAREKKISGDSLIKTLGGNVYVFDRMQAGAGQDQVQAIRIDDVRGDTILVKYKIGNEVFLDADFVWMPSAKNYRSLQPITYGSHAQYKSIAGLYLEDNLLELQLNKHKIHFRKIYNKPVDLKTHRDPYYAEDGFSLSPQ